MLGKASEIKLHLVVEMYSVAIDTEIEIWLARNPNVQVIDIKFSIMPDAEINSVYHEALIIYKEQ